MIVRTIEMLLEYLSIILCIHKVAKVNIRLNYWLIIIFSFEGVLVWTSNIDKIPFGYKFIIFFCLFLYVKYYLNKSWKRAAEIFGAMSLVIMLLQLLCFYFLKIMNVDIKAVQSSGILVNSISCVVIGVWKEKYIKLIIEKLNVIKKEVIAVVFVLILYRILYLCGKADTVDFEVTIQFMIETLGVCIASALWINAETEKEQKKRELQVYETYNKAFEETITTIRIRQHEFENHINAMKSLNYTIKDSAELAFVQEQYCNEVLKGSSINKLLKLNLNPIVIGFLYSKITNAEEFGIVVEFEVQAVDIASKIEIYEFIEIVGILFDNAVEALQENGDKRVLLKLKNEKEGIFSFELANVSRIYLNEELEKFCISGYSSKGKNRGMGLARVKEIVINNNADFLICNQEYSEQNYLSFKIFFGKQ